jgi:dihydropteroate synthase
VLVSTSNKDFVGESLDVPLDDRLVGTLATLAVCAWQGAQVYRVHAVREARQTLDMVAAVLGHRLPARAVRGLA